MRTLGTLLFPGTYAGDVENRPVYLTPAAHAALADCRVDGVSNLLLVLRQTMAARAGIGLPVVPEAGIHMLVFLPGGRPPVCGFSAYRRNGAVIVSRAGGKICS